MVEALEEFRKQKLKLSECYGKYEISKKIFLRHLKDQVERGSERSKKSVTGRGMSVPIKAEIKVNGELVHSEKCMSWLTVKT